MNEQAEYRVCEIRGGSRRVKADPWFDGGLPVVIDEASAGDVEDGDLALVGIPSRGRAWVEVPLGPSTHIESVLDGLLFERGAAWPREEDSDASAEARLAAAEPTDHMGRVDLRQLPTVTIDPESARDFDDAISVSPEGSGWRVWVHIADVSAYVKSGGALDDWARARAFSTYVPGRVSPMLPEVLSAGACSLRPDRDRWCLTTELLLDEQASVVTTTIYRSVIRSAARLSYAEAEQLVKGGSASPSMEVATTVRNAAIVSERLRARRFERGAMRLERPEITVHLVGDGDVARALWEAESDAHALIEELMILTNETVARFLSDASSEALYRVHPDPGPQSVIALISKLSALDVPTPPQPEHLTPRGAATLAARVVDSVAKYTRRHSRGVETLNSLVLRSLERARYEPNDRGHSGLAISAYCHFTSPIRRYPDLVCHRAVLARLGVESAVAEPDLAQLGEHCSERERELAKIEHEANDVCLAWLLDDVLYERGWEAAFDGEVIGVIKSGLFVRFGDVFEGYLPARGLAGDYFDLDELAVSLVGRRFGSRFRLTDSIAVRVDTIDKATGKIKLALCGNSGAPIS